jgi:hypothetical protein
MVCAGGQGRPGDTFNTTSSNIRLSFDRKLSCFAMACAFLLPSKNLTWKRLRIWGKCIQDPAVRPTFHNERVTGGHANETFGPEPRNPPHLSSPFQYVLPLSKALHITHFEFLRSKKFHRECCRMASLDDSFPSPRYTRINPERIALPQISQPLRSILNSTATSACSTKGQAQSPN